MFVLLTAGFGVVVTGCSSSQPASASGRTFEEAIRAPKGPPPAEAAKAAAEELARGQAAR